MAEVDAQERIGLGGLGVEVEGLGVVAQRVGRAQRGERGVACLARVADGLGEVDGLGGAEPVAGQLTHSWARAGPRRGLKASATCRCARARRVGPRSSYKRVLDEGVGEVVAARGVGQLAHQGDGRRGVEDVEQLVLGGLRGPGQHVEVEVAADDRRQRQHPLGVGPESRRPGAPITSRTLSGRAI